MPRRFKVKDLMIDLEAQAAQTPNWCLFPTCGGCTIRISQCLLCTNQPTPTNCWNFTPQTCWNFTPCLGFTPQPTGCGFNYSPCPGISVTDWRTETFWQTETLVAQQPVDLATLREQLRTQLEQLERLEAAQAEAMQPQSIEELDELESRLSEAMEALKQRRSELEG